MPKNQAPNMYINWNNPGGDEFDMLLIDWRCDNEALKTYWAVHQWSTGGHVDGYAGFKHDSSGNHELNFAVWEHNTAYPEIELVSPVTDMSDFTFGDEGNGKHIVTNFTWEVGTWYSMCIATKTVSGKTYYAQWVKKVGDSNWLICGIISFPTSNKNIASSLLFQEDYGFNNLLRKCSVKNCYARIAGTNSWVNRNIYSISNSFYEEVGSTPTRNVNFDCHYDIDSSVPCVWIRAGGESLVTRTPHALDFLPLTLSQPTAPTGIPVFPHLFPRYIKSNYSNLYVNPTSDNRVIQGGTAYFWNFVDSGDGYFYILNSDNTMAITLNPSPSLNDLVMQTFNNLDSQKWTKFSYPQSTDVYFVPKNYPSKCMDIHGPSTSSGAAIQIWTHNFTSNQFKFSTFSTAIYRTIKSFYSNKYVAPSGSQLTQRTLAYRWFIVNAEEDYCYILTRDGRKAITVFETNNGSNLVYDDFSIGNDNQKWRIQSNEAGYFYLYPKVAQNKNMDIEGPSTASGAVIQLWEHNDSSNQFKWYLIEE